MSKKLHIHPWADIYRDIHFSENILSTTIDEIHTDIVRWHDYCTTNTFTPVSAAFITKGIQFNATRLRTTHTIEVNGTPYSLLAPSALAVTFHTHQVENETYRCCDTHPISVIGLFRLDKRYVSSTPLIPKEDAYTVFKTRDEALRQDIELHQYKEITPEIFHSHLCLSLVYKEFLLYIGTLFKKLFYIKEKETTPVSPAYAEKVYDYLKQLYHIRIATLEQLNKLYIAPIVVAHTKHSMRIHPSGYTHEESNSYTYPDHDFVKIPELVYSHITPMLIASCYHTAFNSVYNATKDIIRKIGKEKELEAESSDTVQTW